MSELQFSNTFQIALTDLRRRIIQQGDMSHISVRDLLSYVEALAQFPLGRLLVEKKSIDAFWTDFIMTNTEQKDCSDLEDFILNRSPFTIAWRELLQNFQKITQENLEDGMTLASIPCGAMRELLELDFSSISNFKIIGIDIDLDSLMLAEQLAAERGLSQNISLSQQDAWQLPYDSEIDIITSCGLNIYTSDRQKVLNLYRQFFRALKPGGQLILGFLTYPPEENELSEWQVDKISAKDLFLEKVLYKDILDPQWRNFRTSDEIEYELKKAGFWEVIFHYDTLHVFPTVVGRKKI
jgi:ubiquinone/menaquinone biosynthesis C-methylase UbiE